MCLELTNDATFAQNLVFITCFYFIMFETSSKLYQYIYNANTMTAKKSNFKFSIKNTLRFWIYLIISIALLMIKQQYLCNRIDALDVLIIIICFLISSNFSKAIDRDEQGNETICDIDSVQGLDCGTYMAYGYYHGYLKVILPSTGSLNKGIVEKIENIEDIHNIKILVHKLFILIPSSAYIPPDLKEVSYQWMESAMDLEDEVRNRAGVKRRTYHNSVYKIYPDGKKNTTPVYVVVEGATPLLTFFEAQKHAHRETNIYQKHCKDIVQKFYKKLKEIIDNDPECADVCELIYYDDYDSNRTKVNVAKVILDKLFENQIINSINEMAT